jgi:hypothetical protein
VAARRNHGGKVLGVDEGIPFVDVLTYDATRDEIAVCGVARSLGL